MCAMQKNMASMAATAAMATMAAMAKMTLTIKNFLIYRRMFLNQVPQRTSIFTTSFCMALHNS